MTALEIGFWSFPVLLALIFLRAPVGLAMFTVGVGGMWLVNGEPSMPLNLLKTESYATFGAYSLSIVPMFLLMGQLAALSGMSATLFRAAESWLGHRKGGVAMAAIGACAGFGAICGSSLATAATMGRVALPELKRRGYSGGLATATLAAGGTLGVLIPPSVVLVIYAILTEQNVATMFAAAIAPGVLAALGYIVAIAVYVRLHPAAAGSGDRATYAERFRALGDVWPVAAVFALVVGGIYVGWFTPTEGAAVGVAGTGLLAFAAGRLTWPMFVEAVIQTAVSSAMIFFIILGADLYNSFLALTRMPHELSAWVAGLDLAPIAVLVAILVFYLLLGCLMDSLSMILLTIPVFWPLVQGLDFGLVSLIDLQSARLSEAMREGLAAAPELIQAAEDQLSAGVALTREEFQALGVRPVTEAMAANLAETMTAVWFGVLVLIVVEVGLITPPVGLNLFVIGSLDRKTSALETYKAVAWFVASDLVRVAILILFPSITLFAIL